jgi:hypothetical protein
MIWILFEVRMFVEQNVYERCDVSAQEILFILFPYRHHKLHVNSHHRTLTFPAAHLPIYPVAPRLESHVVWWDVGDAVVPYLARLAVWGSRRGQGASPREPPQI